MYIGLELDQNEIVTVAFNDNCYQLLNVDKYELNKLEPGQVEVLVLELIGRRFEFTLYSKKKGFNGETKLNYYVNRFDEID